MQAERSSGVGMAVRVGLYMAAAVTSIVQRVWNGLTADGYLPAAVRQGADELGAALKAFPDSVQTQEHGTIFNPTQGEIARDRNGNGMQGQWHHSSARNLPTPGQLVREHRSNLAMEQERGQEQERGLEQGRA